MNDPERDDEEMVDHTGESVPQSDPPAEVHFSAADPATWKKPDEMTYGDWALQPNRPLSPRHRRLAELLSAGQRTSEIARALGLTESRVSILRSNAKIVEYVEKIQERMFEETHQQRLKLMGHDALDVIENCLNDKGRTFRPGEKLDTAKWLLEKITGKATQTHDIGENLLSVVMDRLDGLDRAGKGLSDVFDVTPPVSLNSGQSESELDEEGPKEAPDALLEWVKDFHGGS